MYSKIKWRRRFGLNAYRNVRQNQSDAQLTATSKFIDKHECMIYLQKTGVDFKVRMPTILQNS